MQVLDLEEKGIEEDEGILEPTKTPKTKLGDIYDLGDHRLICGDSTSPDVVTSLLCVLWTYGCVCASSFAGCTHR